MWPQEQAFFISHVSPSFFIECLACYQLSAMRARLRSLVAVLFLAFTAAFTGHVLGPCFSLESQAVLSPPAITCTICF